MKKALTAAGSALFILFGLYGPAQADESGGHQADHREHRSEHRDAAEGHADAHEEGFNGRRQHDRYHRAAREEHHEFHDEHPNTRHDDTPRYRRWWN